MHRIPPSPRLNKDNVAKQKRKVKQRSGKSQIKRTRKVKFEVQRIVEHTPAYTSADAIRCERVCAESTCTYAQRVRNAVVGGVLIAAEAIYGRSA